MPRLVITNTAGQTVTVGNFDGFGKSMTIPTTGLTVDLTGIQLESSAPQLTALRATGKITWVKSENPAISDDLEILAGAPARATVLSFIDPPAKSTAGVHASRRGDEAVNLFPGPITNPAIPRNLRAVFGAAWDGGDLTVVGTNQFDAAVTEIVTAAAGTTVVGTKVFKTVTSITKDTVGTDAAGTNTVTVGTGDKLGVSFDVVNTVALLVAGTTVEAVTMDATVDAFTPTTAPDGSVDYTLIANLAT